MKGFVCMHVQLMYEARILSCHCRQLDEPRAECTSINVCG